LEKTLSGGTLVWYSSLAEDSIGFFNMLADYFIKAYAGARKVQPRRADIFKIEQVDSKLLRVFIASF